MFIIQVSILHVVYESIKKEINSFLERKFKKKLHFQYEQNYLFWISWMKVKFNQFNRK